MDAHPLNEETAAMLWASAMAKPLTRAMGDGPAAIVVALGNGRWSAMLSINR